MVLNLPSVLLQSSSSTGSGKCSIFVALPQVNNMQTESFHPWAGVGQADLQADAGPVQCAQGNVLHNMQTTVVKATCTTGAYYRGYSTRRSHKPTCVRSAVARNRRSVAPLPTNRKKRQGLGFLARSCPMMAPTPVHQDVEAWQIVHRPGLRPEG